jgi:ABC-type transporter MlaC component
MSAMRLVFAFFAVLFFGTWSFAEETAPAAASGTKIEAKTPGERVRDLADEAFRIIRTPGTTPKTVIASFKELLKEYFAVQVISTFVLGAYCEEFAKSGLRAAFDGGLENMLVKSYSSKFAEYTGAKFTVTGSVRKGRQFLVSSIISIQNKKDVGIIWYLKHIDNKWMVTDVKIENVSMQKTQKENIGGRIKTVGLEKFMQEFMEKYG